MVKETDNNNTIIRNLHSRVTKPTNEKFLALEPNQRIVALELKFNVNFLGLP